eukprot:CFRG4080T1
MDQQTFFTSEPSPSDIETVSCKVRDFVQHHKAQSRPVVLVTSGGTTVPLEKHTVRFVDNFSAGTRGSASAEYFISKGYAVVFLHRAYSLEPYSRNYTHTTHCFLDFLSVEESETNGSRIFVSPQNKDELINILKRYEKVQESRMLLKVDFTTVTAYLHYLKACTMELNSIGSGGVCYLAAAVSDFFVPASKMEVHKIQSRDGPFQLEMQQVPKMLYSLVKEWCPRAFVVSFKLETDPALLVPKAKRALENYGHQLVVGNILNTRKYTITLVTPGDQGGVCVVALTEEEIEAKDVEIEEKLIASICKMHSEFAS